jgi:nicotinamidase/pyrazinamidase
VPTEIALQKSDALIIVDVQKDFLTGGALAVPRGDEVVPVLNGYIALFQDRGLPIIATRDWHPPDHCSFAAQGGPWPSHCVVGTPGAQFAPLLALPCDVMVISKDTKKQQNTYSGFESADLAERLHSLGSQRLFIGGLATDYCVLNTIRDALELDFAVCLLVDAIRAVNVKPDDGSRAEEEMQRLGALSVTLDQVTA